MNSSSLNYQLTGDNPDLDYVILIHGLFGDLNNLAMVKRELENEFNVLSIDLPDHGQSAFSETFSFENSANAIVSLTESLGISTFSILGHSLGGKVSMRVALDFPDKVTSLIVADIAPVANPPRHDNVFNGLKGVDLAATKSRQHANEQLAAHVVEPGVRQFLLKSLAKDEEQWRWRFNLALLFRDYDKLTAAIESDSQYTGPVLFVKGSESDYLMPEHREAIGKLFPNSQAKVIQGTGHWLHAEKPAMFNRIVKGFLNA